MFSFFFFTIVLQNKILILKLNFTTETQKLIHKGKSNETQSITSEFQINYNKVSVSLYNELADFVLSLGDHEQEETRKVEN